ncbi:unnamed protein product [Alopecurus aequalis]
MDPLSVVGAILTVVQLIGSAAATASQNKQKCLDLAERAQNLADLLPSLTHGALSDATAARVLERLKDAVSEALKLIEACQSGGVFTKYSTTKGAELDSVDKRINNCIMDLTLIGQARAHTTTSTVNKVTAAAPAPAQTYVHVDHAAYYHQAQGGGASTAPGPAPAQTHVHVDHAAYYHHAQGASSSAHGGWAPPPPSPSLQHSGSAPPGYYQYQQPSGPGYAQFPASPAPYYYAASPRPSYHAAPPNRSGSDLSTFYTLPTVNKMFKRVFR